MPSSLRVREIAPGESLRPFVELTWQINGRDPLWISPLRSDFNRLLDRRKHPYHQHAEVAYFLAERGGVPVGRVAATVNRLHNDFHADRTGFFGLFECVEDPEAARALLDAAAEWLRSRGMETMRGPMNLSTNEEFASPGVLVEGFDTPPRVMMGHNPRYYASLVEGAGLEKAMDFLAYWIPQPSAPERMMKLFERAIAQSGATVRSLEMKHFQRDVDIIKRVYNSAWQQNWGFVPMTDAEFAFMAKSLKPIVDPDLCLIMEKDGEPIGFSLTLPDFNQALRRVRDGRLFPFGIFKLLRDRRKIDTARLITLGFTPEYQHAGLGPAFYLRTFDVGRRKGYRQA